MITREELEHREDLFLAPYAAHSRGSRGRAHPEEEHPYRTCYQRDRDRILHSSAFRRLEYKTQVFVNHEGDYYRTRLTHSLETAQIARTAARALALNEDLTESIALSHDLGHTAFGHAGEEALGEILREEGGFNHNQQAVRIVELLEERYPSFSGLNLSWEVRESMRKHSSACPVEPEFLPGCAPLLEAQIVDIADSIAYDAHDLDDALKAGLIHLPDLKDVELWHVCQEQILECFPGLEEERLIKQTVKTLIDRLVSDLVQHTEAALQSKKIHSVEEIRTHSGYVAGFSPSMESPKKALERFLHRNVYQHYRVVIMTERAKRILRTLYDAYAQNPRQIPPRFQQWAAQWGTRRALCDYLAGMTDRYAQEEYQRLFSPFEKI